MKFTLAKVHMQIFHMRATPRHAAARYIGYYYTRIFCFFENISFPFHVYFFFAIIIIIQFLN